MINNKFIFFARHETFQKEIDSGNIPYDSIVFIRDRKAIWNRGVYYSDTDYKDNKAKGFFRSYSALWKACPSPEIGDWAVVYKDGRWVIYVCEYEGVWTETDYVYNEGDIDLDGYVKSEDLSPYAKKSDFKTINRESIIGEGNIEIKLDVDDSLSSSSKNPVQNRVIKNALDQKLNGSDLKTINGESLIGKGDIKISVTAEDVYNYIENYITENGISIDVDSALSSTSKNPVENRAITDALNKKANISDLSNYVTPEEVNAAIQDKLNGLGSSEHSKGYFESLGELKDAVKNPQIGDWAIVNENGVWVIYRYGKNGWENTGSQFVGDQIDLSNYVKISTLEAALATKQDKLISGINIATVNGVSLLAGGNIDVIDSREFNNANRKIEENAANIINIIKRLSTVEDEYISWAKDYTGENGEDNGWGNVGNGEGGNSGYVDLTDYVKKTQLKTVNNQSLVGYGNIATLQLSDLVPYAKKTDFKTINDESILGYGNISILQKSDLEAYPKKNAFKTVGGESIIGYGDIPIVSDSSIAYHIEKYLSSHNYNQVEHSKGYFDSLEELQATVINPQIGDWAIVNVNGIWTVYKYSGTGWVNTGSEFTSEAIDLSGYLKKSEIDTKLSNTSSNPVENRAINSALNEINSKIYTSANNIEEIVDVLNDTNKDLSKTNKLVNEINEKYISWDDDYLGGDYGEEEPVQYISTRMLSLSEREYQTTVEKGKVRENMFYFTFADDNTEEPKPDVPVDPSVEYTIIENTLYATGSNVLNNIWTISGSVNQNTLYL